MKKEYLFDNEKNVKRLLIFVYVGLVVLIILDLISPKHPVFKWEEWPAFYAVYGFVAFCTIVLAAKFILRKIVKREEDYYD
jgi:Kef-type K+ transport system membrane component KefB